MPENTEFSLKAITIVISVAAFVMPAVTTLISNIHQLVMKKIELKQTEYEQNELYKRKVFEEYLRKAGQYIGADCLSVSLAANYTEAYLMALLYAPKKIQKQMQQVHEILKSQNSRQAISDVEELVTEIRDCLLK